MASFNKPSTVAKIDRQYQHLAVRGPLRLALAAALIVNAALSSLAPLRARADFYQRLNHDGTLSFSHDPRGPGWKRVTFPARRPQQHPRGARRRPRDSSVYDAHFAEASQLFALPVAYLRAVARVESAFNPQALSPDGARGLMQLMPFTARKMGVQDAFDPRQNILGGARYLRVLANRWRGDLVYTTASYNAGPGAVERYHGIPPFRETQRYVRRVLHHYARYRGQGTTMDAAHEPQTGRAEPGAHDVVPPWRQTQTMDRAVGRATHAIAANPLLLRERNLAPTHPANSAGRPEPLTKRRRSTAERAGVVGHEGLRGVGPQGPVSLLRRESRMSAPRELPPFGASVLLCRFLPLGGSLPQSTAASRGADRASPNGESKLTSLSG